MKNNRSQLKKIEDLGAMLEEYLILDNRYTEHRCEKGHYFYFVWLKFLLFFTRLLLFFTFLTLNGTVVC